MSKDEVFSIKEILEEHMSNMKDSVLRIHESLKDVQDTANQGLTMSTTTSNSIKTIESAISGITQIIKTHDIMLVENKTIADQTKKISDRNWSIVKWSAPFIFGFLGWVGFLYVEHMKATLVDETSSKVVQLIDDKYNPRIENE